MRVAYTPDGWAIIDRSDKMITEGFYNSETAQLFADCFEIMARMNEKTGAKIESVFNRAAESVEG